MYQPSIDLIQPRQLQAYIEICQQELKTLEDGLEKKKTDLALEENKLDETDCKIIGFAEKRTKIATSNRLEKLAAARRQRISNLEKKIEVFEKQKPILLQSLKSAKKDLALAIEHEKFYEQLQTLGDADSLLKKLSNIENESMQLPFCDRNIEYVCINKRFQFSNDFMVEVFPRERLISVKDIIDETLQHNMTMRKFILYGTIGAGKSYMLMMLACYYMLKEGRTIYFSDARTTLSPVYWKSKLMFVLYQESKKEENQRDPSLTENLEELIAIIQEDTPISTLIRTMRSQISPKLKIFVDQLNEVKKRNTTVFEFTEMLSPLDSIVVYSSSANDEILMAFSNASLTFIPVFSGLNLREYDAWINKRFPELRITDGKPKTQQKFKDIRTLKNLIRYYTGAIPLYLRMFFNIARSTQGSPALTIESFYSCIEIMRSVYEIGKIESGIKKFYSSITENEDEYKKHACACIGNEPIPPNASMYIYRRFFYAFKSNDGIEGEFMGSASCGFAIDALANVMSAPTGIGLKAERKILDGVRLRVVLGFYLENYGREFIRVNGFNECGVTTISCIIPIYNANEIQLVREDGSFSPPASQARPNPFYVGNEDAEYEDLLNGEGELVVDAHGIVSEGTEITTNTTEGGGVRDDQKLNCIQVLQDLRNHPDLNVGIKETAIYYTTKKSNFPAVDAVIVTKNTIVGINYTINENHTSPYKGFLKLLEDIPNLDRTKYKIYFFWYITENCKNVGLFKPGPFVYGNEIIFHIRRKFFDKSIEKIRSKLVEEDMKMKTYLSQKTALNLKLSEVENALIEEEVRHKLSPTKPVARRRKFREEVEYNPTENTKPAQKKSRMRKPRK